ncbi:hypothetical protein GCM10010234_73590 [Streptomyces hawaiiensis]
MRSVSVCAGPMVGIYPFHGGAYGVGGVRCVRGCGAAVAGRARAAAAAHRMHPRAPEGSVQGLGKG